jgi:hypothetical protein
MCKERKVEFLPCVPCATFAYIAVKLILSFPKGTRRARVISRDDNLFYFNTKPKLLLLILGSNICFLSQLGLPILALQVEYPAIAP